MSQQSKVLNAPRTAYDVLSRSDTDPISRLNGVHSSLDLLLVVLQNPDRVDSKLVVHLYNTVYLLAHTIDQVENELEEQLAKIPLK